MTAARTVIGNISLSLDGCVTGPGGANDLSWIDRHAATDGALAHLVDLTGKATTALLGRKTYEAFAGYWPAVASNEDAHPDERMFARWLDDVEKVVLSRTTTRADWPGARIVDTDPADTVRSLRTRAGGDIVVLASPSVLRSLLEAGELDLLSITLCPEVIGGGARLFRDGPAGSSWSLAHMNATHSGAVCLLYDRIRL